MKYIKNNLTKLLQTAGGKIVCARCAAKSKRTGNQCGRPATKNKAVCNFHGSNSSGPRTPEGKARSAAAHTKTGEYTRQALDASSQSLSRIRQLEDAMYVLNMTDAPRTRGRKPNGYVPVNTVHDVCDLVVDTELHKV